MKYVPGLNPEYHLLLLWWEILLWEILKFVHLVSGLEHFYVILTQVTKCLTT